MADTVAAYAKASAIARNDYGNTKRERDEQAVYDRVRQEYIEANDKFSFYAQTVHYHSKVDGKSPVLKFARNIPICPRHVRAEDVTQSTRHTAKDRVVTSYSLKDEAIIYTPERIQSGYLITIVPISALESPRSCFRFHSGCCI